MASATRSAIAASTRRPRLRTVLLLVNVLILLLPLAGIAVLRLYENALIRSTEVQLLGQGAFVCEMFRDAYSRAVGLPAVAHEAAGGETGAIRPEKVLAPGIDVSRDAILPQPPPAATPEMPADPKALSAGAAIEAALDAAAQRTLAGIRVVDRSGTVVASTGSEKGLSLAAREEVARALRGERASVLRRRISDEPTPPLESMSRGQRYRVFVALPVTVEGAGVVGAVVLSRTPLDLPKALYSHRRTILFGAGALLAVVAGVSALTALTIVRPARELMRRAERVARGERGVDVEIAETGTREMAHLARAIADMARTLEERADYIRTFASHVSHEFKTPLTAIRGAVELLRDHLETMSAEERERFLVLLDEASERLERLVRRLLELARADVTAPGDERTDVAEALQAAARRSRLAGLDVVASASAAVGSVRMARETLDEILSNLLDNARVHGGPHVRVRLSARRDDADGDVPAVEITVADDGPGISEANVGKVFTPFFTTARDRGGSGLGLSIVRSLLESHGGSIRVEPSPRGATFVLRIPSG